MNISRNKKLFLLGALIAIVLAIPLTIYLVQRQQDTRTKAQASTTLSFSPTSSSSSPLQKNVNDEFTLTIQIDPGVNLVSFTLLEITYDATKLEPSGTQAFSLNSAALPQILQGPVYTPGKITVALAAGSDPTRALSSPTSLGTVTFRALSNTASPTAVQFGSGTNVSSIAFGDSYSENVLSSSSPSYIQVGSPAACAPQPSGTAGVTYFTANLTGGQEVPAVSTSATGNGQIILSATETSANVYLCFNGLSSTQTAAHIHGPAPSGQEAGIIFTLPNGNFTSHTINNLSSTQVQQLKNGQWYFNVHTSNNPDGEIRGQIQATNPTPTPSQEPTTIPTPTFSPTNFPTPSISIFPSISVTLTPTITPNRAQLYHFIKLHGIGTSGDNTNPLNHSSSNKNPKHTTRELAFQIFDLQGNLIYSGQSVVIYDTYGGLYSARSELLPIDFQAGYYTIKTKTAGHLWKKYPNPVLIGLNGAKVLPLIHLIAGDIDNNNFVDALDYGALFDCGYGDLDPLPMTDSASTFNSEACQGHITPENADLNDDGVIDRKDFNLYLREIQTQGGD